MRIAKHMFCVFIDFSLAIKILLSDSPVLLSFPLWLGL